jgi:hypothetical protein
MQSKVLDLAPARNSAIFRPRNNERSLTLSAIRYIPALAIAAVAGLTACGDSTEPVLIPIPDEYSESEMVDVTTGALTEPSAFDIITGTAVRTDQFSGWDFLFQIGEDGGALWWPRLAITGEDEDAGVQQLLVDLDAVREAPESGYTNLESLPVAVGDVFAMRSRRDPALGNIRCRRFAKMEVLGIDAEEGVVSIRHLRNPNCEKRKLVLGAEE